MKNNLTLDATTVDRIAASIKKILLGKSIDVIRKKDENEWSWPCVETGRTIDGNLSNVTWSVCEDRLRVTLRIALSYCVSGSLAQVDRIEFVAEADEGSDRINAWYAPMFMIESEKGLIAIRSVKRGLTKETDVVEWTMLLAKRIPG